MKIRNLRMVLAISLAVSFVLAFAMCADANEIELPKTAPQYEGSEKWMLSDDGVLRIIGSGKMFDYAGVDFFAANFPSPADSNTNIKEVIIEEGITNIGSCAFFGCSSLESIQIPSTVTYIGEYAFKDCSSLKSIVLPRGVETIEAFAFYGCSSLSSITIGDETKSIGDNFSGTAYYKNPDNWDGNGLLYVNNHLVAANEDIVNGKIEVKDGTKTISGTGFSGCERMTEVILPDGVVSICDGAFDGCDSLEKISIPDSVELMEASFFDTACYKNQENWEDGALYIGKYLVKVDERKANEKFAVKNGTKIIDKMAFSECETLKIITIPDSVIEIAPSTFFNSKCQFYEVFRKPKVNIYGYSNSAAHSYALEYDIPFVDISTATPTNAKVLVNGKEISFTAYNIGGNNYFKLRDVAMAINASEKNFNVGWDKENNAIALTKNQAYTPVGGELVVDASATATKPAVTDSTVYVDGKEESFAAFNIKNNNYFKLRDIGKVFDFGIGWDNATKTITIDTSTSYTE